LLYTIIDPLGLARKMATARASRGQSMQDVASLTGISLSTIVCLERGDKVRIRAGVLMALRGAYPVIVDHVTPTNRVYSVLPAS